MMLFSGILNSILDTSKIEARDMQLEEREFNLVKVVEDVVDLFYPVGLKKKVDVILDIQDPSLTKFSPVKGDEYRLQQILSNLVNNAIKFTKEGYVSVRAYARNPRLQHSTFDSTQDQPTSCLSCFFFKNDEKCKAIDEKVCLDTNFMEFVFEVNDTGIGIPKDKRASVFENYRQVQEAAPKEGTGLGLGIVQSIVSVHLTATSLHQHSSQSSFPMTPLCNAVAPICLFFYTYIYILISPRH